MSDFVTRLRSELLPSSQLEELFFDAIARLSTCASFLARHIERDPDFAQPETPRCMRLLLATESKLRYAYEEFRRLKMARQLQLEDDAQAARPLLAVVATHTSRNGFRTPPRPKPAPHPISRQIQQLERRDAAEDARHTATSSRAVAAAAALVAPGRNSQCPCNSGRKYKHCCANKQAAA